MRVRAFGPAEAWPAPARTAAARPERLIPAILLVLLLGLAFRGVFAGRVFYLRDVVQNHGPLRGLVAERLRAGEWPSWNPYHGGGTPLFANPNSLVLHPTTLVFLVLPPEAALTASVVLQFALLALGGWLLAREIGARREGAALAAAILALSGPAASLASMQNVLAAFSFVPLALWALLRGARRSSPGWLAGAAAAGAVVLMAAEPAAALALVLVGGALLFAGPAAGRIPPRRAALALAAMLAVGLLLAAPQLLAARALLPLTPRAAGLPPAEAWKWSLLPLRLLEVVVPRLFGDPTRLSPAAWWGRFAFEGGYPFLLSLYVGALPCLLALAGLLAGGPDRRRRRALGIAGALGVLLALGGGAAVYRTLYAVLPLARQIRYPERFLLVTLLAVALLAAAGLDRLLQGAVRRRAVTALVAGAASLFFVLVTCLAAAPALVDAVLTRAAGVPAALFAADSGAAVRAAVLRSCLWALGETLVLGAGAALILLPGTASPRRVLPAPRAAAFGLVAFSGLSMVAAAAPALSTAAPGWLRAPSPLREAIGRGPGAPRLRHDPRPAGLSIWARTDEVVWGFRFDRFSYSLLTGHREQVPTVLEPATDRMDLLAQAALGRALDRMPLAERVKILRVAHAGVLLSHDELSDPGLEPGPALEGFSRPPLRLYRVRSPLPRARFRFAAHPPAWPDDPARSLADPRYDPERVVLLDAPGSAGPREAGADGEIPVAVLEDRPERVRMRVVAPRPGWVVLADAWAPGWRAAVDGVPAPVLRADGLFRAVAVPAGEREVTMSYQPPGARAGAGLAATGALLAAALAAGAARRGRR
jgi:hypothetical protein